LVTSLLGTKSRLHLMRRGILAPICHGKDVIRGSPLFVSAIAIIVLVTGCATPNVQPADPQLLLKSDLLGFIQDGVTTREEVVLKLGTPCAQFEEEKILTYQLRADKAGKWHLVAPQIDPTTGFREWQVGTCSLVLVFGDDGVLRKHSLVTAQ